MSKKKPPVDVTVEVAASAKLEVRATVPEQSMGRLVDALTDAIRPFTESQGLKADQIKLQREEVALAIARLALERKQLTASDEWSAVPNKVLVPLLEKASLEDISDNYMIGAWAQLLASAATSDGIPARYAQILSELDAQQAKLLEDICLARGVTIREDERAKSICEPFDAIKYTLESAHVYELGLKALETEEPADSVLNSLIVLLSGPGVRQTSIMLASKGFGPRPRKSVQPTVKLGRSLTRSPSTHLEILISLGLLDRQRVNLESDKWVASATYVVVSELGLDFLRQCSSEVIAYLEGTSA